MTVFTYEKVKRLMEAAEVILSNIYDADEHAPSSGDAEDYADFPRDEDGDLVFPDVFELNEALKALESEDDALPISGDDTVPVGWFAPVPLDSPSRMVYHPDPE